MVLETLEAEGRRRNRLREEIGRLGRLAAARVDEPALRQTIRGRLADLEGFLATHVTQTRQILRKLLVGRLVCAPFASNDRRGYTFTVTVRYDRLVPAERSRVCGDPGAFRSLGSLVIRGFVRVA